MSLNALFGSTPHLASSALPATPSLAPTMSTTTAGVSPTQSDVSSTSLSVDPTKTPAIAPVSKHVLDGVFGIMALMLIAGLCLWRMAYLNRHKLPLRGFFSLHKRAPIPRCAPTQLSTPITVPPLALLTSVSPFSRPRRPRRGGVGGVEVDGQGRRGSWTDKDELPAYEAPPPKYRTLDLEMGLSGHLRMQVSNQLENPSPAPVVEGDAPPYTIVSGVAVVAGQRSVVSEPHHASQHSQ